MGLLGLFAALIVVGTAGAPAPARAQSSYPEVVTSTKPPLVAVNPGYRLLIDSERGTIVSFRSTLGVARDYLVYGGMLRPWTVSGVTERGNGWGKEPLVQSATWQAQDGRTAVVLANYANLPESPRVELEGPGTRKLTINLVGQITQRDVEVPGAIDVPMQSRSLCLIELK